MPGPASAAVGAPAAALVAVAALSAVIGTPFGSGFVALMPEVVDEDALAPANAVITGVSYAAVVVGPALAALALLGGQGWLPFAANGVTFLVSAAFISGLRPKGRGRVDDAERDDGPDDGPDDARTTAWTTARTTPCPAHRQNRSGPRCGPVCGWSSRCPCSG